MKKVMIAMSGGVDSSVCAKIVKDLGYEIIGGTMHLFDKNDKLFYPEADGYNESKDAKAVADRLGIDFYILDFKDEFKNNVIEPFINCYKNGGTPNPCLYCNKWLKFSYLIDKAVELGCESIATGHYAQIVFENNRYKLKRATDLKKDQSYVLYSMTQQQLSRTLFPLGELTKEQVKEIAQCNNFVTANKKESQDICFVPDGDYASFISRYNGEEFKQGNFIDKDGNVLGKHKGIVHYTIGQRKGLGLSLKKPGYVCNINPTSNTVTIGDNEDLFSKQVEVADFNWVSIEKPKKEIKATAKIRYNMADKPCTVYPLDNNDVKVVFDEPQRAATKGQACVVYQGDYVVGGGIIK